MASDGDARLSLAPESADAPEASASSELTRLFSRAADSYISQLEALVDLIESITPHVRELDSPDRVFATFKQVVNEVPKGSRGRLIQILKEGQYSPRAMTTILDEFHGEIWAIKFVVSLRDGLRKPRRMPIMTSAMLMTVISTFESHVAHLTTIFFKASPEALEAVPKEREKEFSLRDLKGLGDIDQAIDLAIERRVDDLRFGSFLDWRKFYNDRLNVDFADLAIDWERVQEVFERRHVVVHSGGRASKRYVARTRRPGVSVGDPLGCDEEYLLSAIDELLTLGLLVLARVWLKFEDVAEPIDDTVSRLAYNLLKQERWDAVQKLTSFGLEYAPTEADRSFHRVNNWLARAGKGEKTWLAEVERWDVSATSDLFKLAKDCLLDDRESAFANLRLLVDAGEVTPEDLLEWPLLAKLRDDSRFNEFGAAIQASLTAEDEQLVFVSPRARAFHIESCVRRPETSHPVTLGAAVEAGLRPCKTCGVATRSA